MWTKRSIGRIVVVGAFVAALTPFSAFADSAAVNAVPDQGSMPLTNEITAQDQQIPTWDMAPTEDVTVAGAQVSQLSSFSDGGASEVSQ